MNHNATILLNFPAAYKPSVAQIFSLGTKIAYFTCKIGVSWAD